MKKISNKRSKIFYVTTYCFFIILVREKRALHVCIRNVFNRI